MKPPVLSLSLTALALLSLPLTGLEIIAHRGASHDAPENTMAAFKLGWEQKADADEVDIYLTKDGRIVVIHDKTTKRTAGLDRNVAEQNLVELRALDAGAWKGARWAGEKIPSLEEVIATIPEGRRLFIEIKCGPEVLPELERVVKESGKKSEQLTIICFNYETLKLARERFPELALFWLVAPTKESNGLLPAVDELITKAKSAKFEGLNVDYRFAIDDRFVSRVKDAGLKLYIWTVNDPAVARRLAALGADGITTDRPGWLREQLALPDSSQPSAKADHWNASSHVPLDRFIIQSHRGAGVLAPENTIEAFELGWKVGTYPEADVRTTKDGVLVAFHDATFERVVKGADAELKQKGVRDLSYEELSRLDVGAWAGEKFQGRRVSRLSEVFALMKGKPERHVYLDIKEVKLPQLAEEVKAAGVERQVVLAAPNPKVIREWKALVPDSDTLLWMGGSEEDLRKRLHELRESGFPGITQLQIHIRPQKKGAAAADPFTLSDRFIVELGQELRARNILFQALPYTDSPGVYAKLLDLGLASFATDHPEAAWQEIRAYYSKKQADR
jgi:glycerophosphoryl diester phosphodiesterase